MDLSTLLVAVATFLTVMSVGLATSARSLASGGKAARRVQSVATSSSTRIQRKGAVDASGSRRKQVLAGLKTAEQQDRKAKLKLRARILQAGLTLEVKTFWIVSGVLAGVALVVGALVSHNPFVALGAAFVVGLGLPRWWLSTMAKRRFAKFLGEFPNAIDIIVRGIKSGLPVNDCLRVIANESPEPVGGEFRRMVENIGGGVTLDASMEKMYARMPLSEVRFFAIVLAIQQKTGGNLAEALGNLSTVLRSRKLMREKVKALSGEAVASAAIIGSLPPAVMGLVSVVAPGYMGPLFFTPGGHFALGVACCMMAMGTFIMKRMINFKT